MKIMVVDDVGIMRLVLTDVLVRYCGVEKRNIVEATGGKDAVSKYGSEKPHLVFLDIIMPDLCGKDVVKELKEIDPAAKIIMCTSSGEQSDVTECMRLGAIDYIKKPPIPERVQRAYRSALGIRAEE